MSDKIAALLDGEIVDLHEDLQEHLFDTEFGQMIHHPLVVTAFHTPVMNKIVNHQYDIKAEAVAEAWRDNEWGTFVFLHERPYRLDAFLEAEHLMDDDTWWKLLGRVWIDSENIRQNQDVWNHVLRAPERGSSHAMMTDEEYEALRALPETFTVWQGCTDDRDDGWSWTTRRETAEWFANRFASMERAAPRVREAVVRRDDVTAYLLGRNEFEILIDPELVEAS